MGISISGVKRLKANFDSPSDVVIVPPPTDSLWSNVSLYAPFTSLADSKSGTYQPMGSPTITEDSPYGGGSSLHLNGSSYVITPSVAIGSQSYTIEFWLKREIVGAGYVDYVKHNTNGPRLVSYNNQMYVVHGSSTVVISASKATEIANYEWHHIAIAGENGNAVKLFIDGALVGQAARNYNFTAGSINLGYNGSYMSGNITDFRVTIGAIRYPVAPFAVPTGAFPSQ